LDKYASRVIEELVRASLLFKDRTVETIYFGGGTPSVLAPERLCSILAALRDSYRVSNNAEITFETNPAVLDISGFARLREAGFDRVSIGVQSMDSRVLEALGRAHGPSESLRAIESAHSAGFRSICVDFMSAVPRHYLSRGTMTDLSLLKDRRIGHASVYQFTLCEGTKAREMVESGILVQPAEGEAADEYLESAAELEKMGFIHYEISNFARGELMVSRHNSAYWSGADYLGVGAAAVSTIGDERRSNTGDLGLYLNADFSSSAYYSTEKLGEREKATERLMLGLRTRAGISRESLGAGYFEKIENNLSEYIKKIAAEGLAVTGEGNIKLTSKGFLVMNGIAAKFLAAMGI